MIRFLSFLLVIFVSSPAIAWWDSSHMVVAQIASNRLTPRAKFHAEELISLFAHYNPSSADFVTASCWADDVKNGICDFSSWHKQLIPYDPDDVLEVNEKKLIESCYKENGLAYGIETCINVLKNREANYYDKGLALRLLIHLVADAHMPLHCAALYNKHFPKGDKGGILFTLDSVVEIDSLHGLWDSCIFLDYYEFKRPLTINGKKYMDEFVQELTLRFPPESLPESGNLDVNHWIQESYHLAINVAYKGIEPNTPLSKDYLKTSRSAACQQLAIAGYRLAALLNGIFENYK